MATPNINPFNKYIGNGATTQFSVGFPYIKSEYVHVYIRRTNSPQEEVSPSDWEWVNENTIRFPATGSSEAILASGEILVVQRETPTENEFTFLNQQRLFPEDVMKADDLDMHILQELSMEMDRAIKFLPTQEGDPQQLINEIDTVYYNIDSLNAVANNISDVNAVGSNIADVVNCATNLPFIVNASTYANAAINAANLASGFANVASNASIDASAYANTASNAATNAATNSNNAHIWAEGTDTQVSGLGGQHSSKGWSDISKVNSLPIGAIITSEYPLDMAGIEPLNSPTDTSGRLITQADETYALFWQLCVSNKAKAVGGDARYNRFNKTQAEYTTELTAKGFCGFYVIDEVNKTIRLPYYGTAFLQSGNGTDIDKEAGLPNITGQFNAGGHHVNPNTSGAFSVISDRNHGNAGNDDYAVLFGFDASLSSTVYKNDCTTVQPESVMVYYYVVCGNTLSQTALIEVANKQDKSNLVSTVSSSSTDSEYPSAKCLYDTIGDIQTLLENI